MNVSPHDPLTGLPGRLLLETLQVEFQGRDSGQQWTFVMIDIDHFKLINDIYGHLCGDQVLKEVAGILKSNLRKTDIMLRFGGDEFLGVFRDTDTEHALNYSERVMDDLRKISLLNNLKPTLSMGLADSKPDERTVSAVIDRADKALYSAKESGRGRISFATDAPQVTSAGAIRLGHFVGRRNELNSLRQLLDESSSEGARFALIEGDAGVGKSRLASELIHYAKFKKCTLFHAQCFEFGDSEPYGFILLPLRAYLARLENIEIKALLSGTGPFHPATAELFPGLPIETSGDLQFFREERLKFRIFEDFSRFLQSVSTFSSVLFIVDDIQWMTLPDLELFKYIIRSARNNPITFVTTMRSREKSSDDMRRHIHSLNRMVPFLHLKLDNLEKQETFNLIMFALKDPNVPQRVMETIYRQSGGNPFFLEELINSLIQTGSITRNRSGDWSYYVSRELQLPESLAQLISSRLYPLAADSRNYLRIAALTAGNFTVEIISAAADENPLKVVQGLEESVQLGLIVCETGTRQTYYRFTHDTICSFLHRELSAAMKKVYHVRMGIFLENRYHEEGGDDLIIAMAHHYSESNDTEKASWSALLAAKVFENRQANRDTVRWLEIYFLHSTPSRENQPERLAAHRKLGGLYMVLGHFDKAMGQFEIASELVRTPDEKAEIMIKKGHVYQDTSRYEEARTCYQNALDVAVHPLKHVDALNSLAFLYYLAGDLAQALEKVSQAEKILAETDAEPGLLEKHQASLFTTKGVIQCAIMPGPIATREYEKALTLFVKHGDYLGQATIYNNLSDIYSRTGFYEKALDALKKAEEIDTRLDDALNMAIVFYNTAILYSEINQPIPAREYFQRYADISRDINNDLGLGYSNLGAGELYEEEGDLDKAEAAYRKAIEIFTTLRVESMALAGRLSLVHVLILKSKIDEAESVFKSGIDLNREILERDLQSDVFFIQGLLKLGRVEEKDDPAMKEAEMLISRSLEMGRRLDVSFLMRRYYHLLDIQRRAHNTDGVDAIRKEAQSVLSERLSHIEKQFIRDNICRKRYIRDFVV